VPRRRVVALISAAGVLLAAAVVAYPYIHGLSFVVRAANLQGALRRAADLDTAPVRESVIRLSLASRGSLRARVFQPPRARRAVLLVSGLHPAGIDDPRLVELARQLSASRVTVVTPEIPELSDFEITRALTDAIEHSAGWLAAQSELAPDGRIGMVGVSFSGGLTVVAAGRSSLAGKVAYVFALGGHHDLPRVLTYLCTGVAESRTRPPHVYGGAVLLLGAADRVVPAGQVGALRVAIRRFLWASYLNNIDEARAAGEFAALRALAMTMPEPSATLLKYVNDGDVGKLGARLLPYVGSYGADPALSPSKSPKPSAPIFLLHGVDDNVIPSSESRRLAEDFRAHTPVRLLITPLISHVDADQSMDAGEIMRLTAFSAHLLSR
jgi:dienelactone hydrolase